jgi:hypothetical protein
MRLPLLLARAAGGAAVAALAITGTMAAGVATAPAASARAAPPAAEDRPISPDAPFDTPEWNEYRTGYPAVLPARGTDYGHLPRWKHFADGRVLLREDRVTLRRQPYSSYFTYTNVNPLIRSYWLDRAAVILVGYQNYVRMTGDYKAGGTELYRVGRQRFLDSFNTGGNEAFRALKYRSVYRLTFDRTHTHIRKIEEMRQFVGCC